MKLRRACAIKEGPAGNTFGGMASFEIAEQYPGYFTAILALCPAMNYSMNGTARLSTLTASIMWSWP